MYEREKNRSSVNLSLVCKQAAIHEAHVVFSTICVSWLRFLFMSVSKLSPLNIEWKTSALGFLCRNTSVWNWPGPWLLIPIPVLDSVPEWYQLDIDTYTISPLSQAYISCVFLCARALYEVIFSPVWESQGAECVFFIIWWQSGAADLAKGHREVILLCVKLWLDYHV